MTYARPATYTVWNRAMGELRQSVAPWPHTVKVNRFSIDHSKDSATKEKP